MEFRNIAIIAHVDHGKTTLVDQLMRSSKLFRDDEVVPDCFLDSNDQERERGITILAKNIALEYKGIKINIVDTPGHADFSGEVERTLRLADGCLLLVDAFEGVRPQTRYVLKKALENDLRPIVVINKMDRANRRPKEVVEMVHELFLDVAQNEHQLEFPVVYASGREGWASLEEDVPGTDIQPLMDVILKTVPQPVLREGPLQVQFTSFDYSDYVGRIGIGRIFRGTLKADGQFALCKKDSTISPVRIKDLYTFAGLGKAKVAEVECGDLCAVVGLPNIDIGDTLCAIEAPEALPSVAVDEPTISMLFRVNDSPLYGREGKFSSSRHLKEALDRALEKDVSLRVEKLDREGEFRVYGRGVLHISVLIENMRRKGYELAVGQPQVVTHMVDGVVHEPYEELMVEVGEAFAGKVMEAVAIRRGRLIKVDFLTDGQAQTYQIPSRGLIGLRSQLLGVCSGHLVMMHRFAEYRPQVEIIPGRANGSMVSLEAGLAIPYALNNLQDRGVFFVNPGDVCYAGMVVGEYCKTQDLWVNLQKEKKLSNMRAAGKDKDLRIAPAKQLSLEECLEFIGPDELVEITPLSIRLRKMKLSQ